MTYSNETSEAISRMMALHPFFSVLMAELATIKEDENLPAAGATDGKNVWVNPKKVASWTPAERVFLLAHEIMHIVFDHPSQMVAWANGAGPDGQPWSQMRANVAMDMYINELLSNAGLSIHASACRGKVDLDTEDWIAIYKRLPEGKDSSDDHSRFSSSAFSKAEIQRALKQAANAAKAMGSEIGGLKRIVDDYCEAKVAWQDQLDMNIEKTAGRDALTWRRPNRKKLARTPSIYMPGNTSYGAGTIAVYVDTSGSISEKELQIFMGEMSAIIEKAKPEATYLGSCDHVASDPMLAETVEDVATFQPEGGGGTNMPAIFEKLEDFGISPDCLVVLTDGYTPWGSQPDYPVIWVITSNVDAPYGKTIKISI